MMGITRVRNESLILEDTLNHFLGYCDSILLLDDDSDDNTAEIAESFDRVEVIRETWREDRNAEETRHRKLLTAQAGAEWVLCFDADERLEGELPDLKADAYRFRLYDGYLTPDHTEPYTGGDLASTPRLWGPEYRDIVFLYRPARAFFDRPGMRAPGIRGTVEDAAIRVKHFGKCLSVSHWEETCDYYIEHFPMWREKWRRRKGKALHTLSDFGNTLYRWDDVDAHGVPL
tara:strand:+ start:22766 stop:23458 length:693 start_codon:yes stop_codon:yes gene_type:complete